MSKFEEKSTKSIPDHWIDSLKLVAKRDLPPSLYPEIDLILASTLNDYYSKYSQIHSSKQNFLLAILHNHLLNLLLIETKKGDREAYNRLIVVLNVRISSDPQFFSKRWMNILDEDLLQDAFEVFCKNLEEKVESNPYLYFKQIVTNKMMDKMKSLKRARERMYSPISDEGGSEDAGLDLLHNLPSSDETENRIVDKEFLGHVQYAISGLTAFCREFFRAVYLEEDQTAWRKKLMSSNGMSESAINTRIHRCRHTLKIQLIKKSIVHV